MTQYRCCDERRLEVIKVKGSANAIEFLEVLDRAAPPGAPRQQTLFVRLLRPGFALGPENLRITGGERIASVGVVWSAPANALPPQAEAHLVDSVDDLARTLVVRTDGSGDHSTYTFAIISGAGSDTPPAGFDPRLSSVEFSFKVECPSDFDCAAETSCAEATLPAPTIDYLARDYQGFRRLMLDRLSLLVPGWTERSPADVGVAMVELLAYAADNLAYRQDAIANEAYLATARQRVSVRRHARLVDYVLHEGCNARAFVHFNVSGPGIAIDAGTQLLTKTPDLPAVIAPGGEALRSALDAGALVFEVAHNAVLDAAHNKLSFYTWGDEACCLARGATSATLRGKFDKLHVGDFVVLEELVSPTTLVKGDADPSHRWVVRLTDVTLSSDPSGQLFGPDEIDGPVDVTEIAWDQADALPFALCLTVADHPDVEISAACGNVVLADHGAKILGEDLGVVPGPSLWLKNTSDCGCADKPARTPVPARYRPAIANAPLTQGWDISALLEVPIQPDKAWWPASSLGAIAPRTATPRITSLKGQLAAVTDEWIARPDLLSSGSGDPHVVVEVDDNGRARLRFGDDTNGKRPATDTHFTIDYRVGNGVIGNVGAESIAHIVSVSDAFTAVRNPTPATGGVEPEDIEAARRDAPQAFRTQERAVTAADYAAAAERRPDVQRAAATFRWTGSWYTARVTADRFGGGSVDALFSTGLRNHLERFRMAGYDLDVGGPTYVPLDVALNLCINDDYFRSDVLGAVADVLSSRVLANGQLGFFHPDRFTFGQSVYLSQIIAAAQAVEGVDSVRAVKFQRLVGPDKTTLATGVIPIGSLEIAELANNPDFRERGVFTLTGGGGK